MNVQFQINTAYLGAHGVEGDGELFCDGLHRVSLGQRDENGRFPLGEVVFLCEVSAFVLERRGAGGRRSMGEASVEEPEYQHEPGKRMTSRALKQIRSTKPEASQRPVRSTKGLLWK